MSRSVFKTFAKLTLTGMTIVLIAFVFGVFTPEADVKESEADILALGFGPAPSHEVLADSLKSLGHPEPWPLNVNGNTVYFSSKVHKAQEPREVMQDYLRKFYDLGLNRQDYSEAYGDDFEAIGLDAFAGGVVPIEMSNDHIVLGGMSSAARAETSDDLHEDWENHNPEEFHELFSGFRHITIDRDGPETLVSSVWSDEEFDYTKMDLGSRMSDVNTSHEFPSCPGCIRLNSFESLNSDRPYESAAYLGGGRSLDEAKAFYDQTLRARGWEPTEASATMAKVRQHVEFKGKYEARMLQYAREGRFMTVMLNSRGNQYVANMSISD